MSPRFQTTRWSLVRAAQGGDLASARRAFAELCEAYWPPLVAHARRRGASREEAEDAAQILFARLIERDGLSGAAPEHGRLRSFLLACLQNEMSHEREREAAMKRGGGRVVSLQALEGPSGEILEPSPALTPEQAFERAWALTVLDRARAALRRELEAAGKRRHLDVLAPVLAGDGDAPYAVLAEQLQCTEGAVKVAVHRLRRRFGEILRAEIAHTVHDPADVDDELRHLLRVLSERAPS